MNKSPLHSGFKHGINIPEKCHLIPSQFPNSDCNNIAQLPLWHYSDVIMSTMASQINGVLIAFSTVCLGAGQRKHQNSASVAYGRGMTGGFPSEKSSNAENVSIWWRHYEYKKFQWSDDIGLYYSKNSLPSNFNRVWNMWKVDKRRSGEWTVQKITTGDRGSVYHIIRTLHCGPDKSTSNSEWISNA